MPKPPRQVSKIGTLLQSALNSMFCFYLCHVSYQHAAGATVLYSVKTQLEDELAQQRAGATQPDGGESATVGRSNGGQ
jgi:hypothetical protein